MNSNIRDKTENYLKLSDGRKLCYAEYGDPKGFPIFVFHGNPNSRLLWGLIPGSPFLPNVRLIAPDRPGGAGTWYDAMIPANWPIPLEEIKIKVYLWQGEEDISVPPAMGRYIAKKIPDCEAKFIKGAGHFWIFEHLAEMLEKLVKRQ
jgi:pimeloyl-ACP methyl ester carboxylesterase